MRIKDILKAEMNIDDKCIIYRTGDWEKADAAIGEIYDIFVKYDLWDSESACNRLLDLAKAAFPLWLSGNRDEIISSFQSANNSVNKKP